VKYRNCFVYYKKHILNFYKSEKKYCISLFFIDLILKIQGFVKSWQKNKKTDVEIFFRKSAINIL